MNLREEGEKTEKRYFTFDKTLKNFFQFLGAFSVQRWAWSDGNVHFTTGKWHGIVKGSGYLREQFHFSIFRQNSDKIQSQLVQIQFSLKIFSKNFTLLSGLKNNKQKNVSYYEKKGIGNKKEKQTLINGLRRKSRNLVSLAWTSSNVFKFLSTTSNLFFLEAAE